MNKVRSDLIQELVINKLGDRITLIWLMFTTDLSWDSDQVIFYTKYIITIITMQSKVCLITFLHLIIPIIIIIHNIKNIAVMNV